jgi:hypothetical protein
MGLDTDAVGIDSPEVVAAAIRRAASFRCPTTSRELENEVVAAFEWLVPDRLTFAAEVSSSLDALINYGDLLDLSGSERGSSRSADLFLAPPAFVPRESGGILLVGIPAEGQPIVSGDLAARLECERHVRTIPGPSNTEWLDQLLDSGLFQLRMDQWLTSPRPVSPTECVADYDARLAASRDPGPIDGLRILDPSRPVRYYAGRWRVPTARDSSRYVARRPRAYGSDAWCYVQLENGHALHLVDLPVASGLARGCDEAWRLQAAIDAQLDHPQVIQCRPGAGDAAVVGLTTPPPSWLQRRWDALGKPIIASGALLAYRFAPRELEEELAFVKRMLWARVES